MIRACQHGGDEQGEQPIGVVEHPHAVGDHPARSCVERVHRRPRGRADAELDLQAARQREPSLGDGPPPERPDDADTPGVGQPVVTVDVAPRDVGEQHDVDVRVLARRATGPGADERERTHVRPPLSPPDEVLEDRGLAVSGGHQPSRIGTRTPRSSATSAARS